MDSTAQKLWDLIDSQMHPRDLLAERILGVRLFDADGRDCIVLFSEAEAADMMETNPANLQIEIFKRINEGELHLMRRAKKITKVNE